MKDQASSNNNMLKHQIENTQRETEYYKKQMEIFKDQMHKANIREQKVESELSFFKTQVGKYED
jgi:predicted phage tail protein|tara:strand:- start:2070 stop:2261 length:192 start_codon:yes stop_codon:yes gene_type:complete